MRMDVFEFNKIAGAVLATALAVMGVGIIADFIYQPIAAEEPAYVIVVATVDEGVEEGTAPAEAEPIALRLQVADVDQGQKQAKKCFACHTFEQGGANKVGPNLWDIVGRATASLPGFGYSEALTAAGGRGSSWTFEDLDNFLEAPKSAINGTSMGFVGLKEPGARADVISYLRSLSASPVPLPSIAAAEPAAEAGDSTSEEAPAGAGDNAETEAKLSEPEAGAEETTPAE